MPMAATAPAVRARINPTVMVVKPAMAIIQRGPSASRPASRAPSGVMCGLTNPLSPYPGEHAHQPGRAAECGMLITGGGEPDRAYDLSLPEERTAVINRLLNLILGAPWNPQRGEAASGVMSLMSLIRSQYPFPEFDGSKVSFSSVAEIDRW